jgi:outer membrane protein
MELATVDITRILDESKRGQSFMKKIREMTERYDKEGMEIAQKLQDIRDKMAKVSESTPRAFVVKMQRDAQFFEAQLNQLRQRAQGDVSVSVEHYRNIVLDEIQSFIASYAKDAKIDLVLPVGMGQALYVSPKTDITQAVLLAYDKAQGK